MNSLTINDKRNGGTGEPKTWRFSIFVDVERNFPMKHTQVIFHLCTHSTAQ